MRDEDVNDEENSSLTNDIGTRLYMSPEQTSCTNYDEKSDIYSMGLVIYRIFQPIYTTMEKVVTFEFPIEEEFEPPPTLLP